MNQKPQKETEIKFFIGEISPFEKRLTGMGASLASTRTHELNYRFDTEELALAREYQVLRLRQDSKVHLTFKGGTDPASEVSSRREIEFEVSDFDSAQQLLLALGYHITFTYEKYRTTYHADNCEIVLDELPYGNFLEIEGKDIAAIKQMATRLQLNWDERIKLSYLAIFQKAKEKFGLQAANLLFAEVDALKIPGKEFFASLSHAR
jgi:adenylate cyclase, class 2